MITKKTKIANNQNLSYHSDICLDISELKRFETCNDISDTVYSKADIHIHSSYSDGTSSPESIIDAAAGKLQVIAITDHNRIKGAFKAKEYALKNNIKVDVVIGEEGMHQTINININGKYEDIDIAIAPAIAKLNKVGAETENSCQGGDTSSQAYITLKSGKFPDELVSAWKGAGFYVSKHIVRAAYKNTLNSDNPFSDIIEKYASILFQKSLNDWLKGDLDTTGKKYRLLRI